MPSPFPGMNPYLEQDDAWSDFHQRFCPAMADFIATQIEPNYIAKVDQHIYIQDQPDEGRDAPSRPDVIVARVESGLQPVSMTAVLEAPERVVLPEPFEVRLPFIEIQDRRTRRVVTAIELLSPSNKTGKGRLKYLAKRAEYLASRTHLVEIDLLRGGTRPPPTASTICDYRVLISRVEERPDAGLWPIRLRDPLPVIPIPLRAPDADARLDLKAVLDRVYDSARYANYIFKETPQPPLNDADAAWAEGLLKAQGAPSERIK